MPASTSELQYNPYVIKLSPAQQETLAALARLSVGKLVWVSTAEIVAERLRTKGLESGKSKQAAGFRLSTENALGQIKNVVPQLVLSNVDSWKLTVPGGCVVDVQLGLKGNGDGKQSAESAKSAGIRPGRDSPTRSFPRVR